MPSAHVPGVHASPRAARCGGGTLVECDEHAASANATVIQRMPSDNARAAAA
jgi:hypothetical protein